MNKITVFSGGDIYGDPGMEAFCRIFPQLKKSEQIDFAVVNGENASGGKGLTENDMQRIFAAGIDVVTGGNHTFEKRELYSLFDAEKRLLRPENYPEMFNFNSEEKIPGRGFDFFCSNSGVLFAVLNLQGRENMTPIECPFATAQKCAARAAKKKALLLVDFHAESNEEKEALGIFLDGTACAVCGTHTHVQTADERILRAGTAYITDLGMTGCHDSVIGTKTEIAILRNKTQILYKLENAEGAGTLQGVLIDIDLDTKKAIGIKRVSLT